mmetsp:Transcript_25908/g.31936  ORF Transcript_25908/g.31936 Transcript_25908/m.31936 type:complete len:184 (-) Transcript_25908:794-1345(-)
MFQVLTFIVLVTVLPYYSFGFLNQSVRGRGINPVGRIPNNDLRLTIPRTHAATSLFFVPKINGLIQNTNASIGNNNIKFVKVSITNNDETALHAKKERFSVYEESEKRGQIIFAFVFLLVVWGFTIPPELRREHFCFARKCRLDNTANLCYNCISFSEWTAKVADYYKGGGGVHFDFSVEPKD